jgi:hypothetical protein
MRQLGANYILNIEYSFFFNHSKELNDLID